MAFTKTQLEALKNALLASNQPITAPIHREFAQKIIDELYDAQSRANLLSAIQNDSSLLTTDSVFVIRNGQGFLIPSSQVGGTGSLANLTDTVIIDPQDGEVIIYNSVTEKWENRVAGVVFNDFYVRHDIDNQGLDATQKSNATSNIGAQSILEKGQADGYASLDGTGRVPSSQLPSFVDDVLEFADLASFPTTGESGKIYIALDTNKTYRWGGTTYVEISAGVVLGETETTAYRGDRGKIAYDYSQIGHLPLTGGTLASSGSTNTLDINHASGSGTALNITKAGNGEGLKVVKTSGSGLAASITGGVTLLDELNLTTKLADAHIASADTWNAKIGGTIDAGQVAFGTPAGVIGGDAGLTWDNVNKRLGVGTSTPTARLHVQAQGALSTDIAFRVRNSANTFDIIRAQGNGNVFIGLAAGDSSTGSNNILFGVNAGRDTSGNNNVFIGFSSGRNNTTGLFNSFIGDSSGLNNTTGITNAYTGAFSMSNNTTGGSNIANGFNAGRFIADGTTANTITNNSVFLGAGTKALADNQTNQIVIGTSAIGLGSNTAVLGNDSITFTGLKGNVGVNTTTNAGFRLDVNGTARIVGATRIDSLAGTGTRMVVADANGVMSTQALGIGGSGTTNYLAKFTDGGTVGRTIGIFESAVGNVGIGTINPDYLLDVANNFRFSNTEQGSLSGFYTCSNTGEITLNFGGTTTPNKGRITYSDFSDTFSFSTNSTERMRITSGGNVGIGTHSPSLLFSVLNKVGVDNDGRLFWGSDFSGNNRGLLTWDANSARIQSGSTSTSLDFAIGTGDIRMRLSTNNNLLINTTTDAGFRLDVNGTARATAFFTSSDKRKKDIISQDGDLAIYKFKGDDQIHYGYIAQDMEDLYPNQVSTDNDGMLSLNYIEILVKKVHDLETKLKRHGLD